MSKRFYQLLSLLVLVSLVGCTGFPFNLGEGQQVNTQPAEGTQIPSLTTFPGGIETPSLVSTQETADATQALGGQFVRIWLPPEFDPAENSVASRLLKDRLGGFEAENPGVQLEVRVKALEGPGGLLDSLVAAGAAAPSALPDLILLPRPLLESAALKGLLYPYDSLTNIMDDQSWFDYARQLAHLKASTYGIPFAGDMMILAYSPSVVEIPPLDLESVLTRGEGLLYPAADPQALFSLSLYLAGGGRLQDEQGRPILEETPLVNLLDFYQRAIAAEVIPYTLTEYAYDSQVWEAFLSGQYPMAVTWTSTFLRETQADRADLAMAPLPTPDGTPFTLATGWSWALAVQDPSRRILSVELAEYMVEKDFLAKWSRAAGYLPPRVDALQSWEPDKSNQVLEQISYSAWLQPSADLVSNIGPALQHAVMDVLTDQIDPQRAARAVIDEINQP